MKDLLSREYVTNAVEPYLFNEFLIQLSQPFLYTNNDNPTPSEKVGKMAY